jgi:excisionase family DNA binding protein
MPRQAVKPVPLVCVSPFQASEATGIRQERIARAIRDGELRAYRVGTKSKILVSELERWIASHDPATRESCHV